MFDIGSNLVVFSSVIYVFIFVFGLILGSFLNSWIWRTRENIRIICMESYSICVNCRQKLKWYDKFPIFSFLFLRGRCRTCHKAIPWHYLAVELISASLLLLVAFNFLRHGHFSEWHFLRDIFFLTCLIVIFVYDALYQEVLARLVWLGMVVGGLINFCFLHYSIGSLLLGSAIGGGFFLLQYLVSQGRWIGGGDVRLGFMIGIWLGWPQVLVALFLAYIIGALFSIGWILGKKKEWKSAIPFGTFLAFGTFVALYHAHDIINWYIKLLR